MSSLEVSAVAYTRGELGAELLLLEGDGGTLSTPPFAAAAADERLAVSARQLSEATGSLLAPSGGAASSEAHLLAKLTAGKGIVELRASARVLFLVPTRRAPPPPAAAPRLEWWPLARLLPMVEAEPRRLDGALRALLEPRDVPAQLWLRRAALPPAAPHAAAPPADEASVPRQLATDLFVGEAASATQLELLRALGVTHLLLFDAPPPHGGDAAAAATRRRALEAARQLGATVAAVEACDAAVAAGEAEAVLREACGFVGAALGCRKGVVLLAGPLRLAAHAGAAWAACAHLAARGELRVAAAFARCRALFPEARMSAGLAAAAQAYAEAQRAKAEAAEGEGAEAAGGRKKAANEGGGGARERPRMQSGRWVRVLWPAEAEGAARAPQEKGGVQYPPGLRVGLEAPPAAAAAAGGAATCWRCYEAVEACTCGLHTPSGGAAAASCGSGPSAAYRCRKCRAMLFTTAVLEVHEKGGGQGAFRWHKRETAKKVADANCESYFLQSDATTSLEQVEGKICCSKCSARIGSYNWSGSQCSCGAWITPAIQVVKSKVDETILS
ncbi:hypothetical protein AB1Y20_003401 [Prymnesium parvum]|uniref:protein-tyrosine-phosphatase n=1 Tax=Prymnesium parvum TaxID=97485 RepID=A0AB34JBR7_PRYPA